MSTFRQRLVMKSDQVKHVIEEISELYEKYGSADYIGEPVSQIEHMSQCAQLAIRAGEDDEMILAAFFHDIGHICESHDKAENMGGFGKMRHEQVGAAFLRGKGFPERVAALVENHVQAKRYLTYVSPGYYKALSEASKATLTFQGGVMSEVEAKEFEASPYFEDSIRLRHWDELAKETGIELIEFEMIQTLMQRTLSQTAE